MTDRTRESSMTPKQPSRRAGLGRGLEALIPSLESQMPSAQVSTVPIASITPNPRQPRSTMDQDELDLAAGNLKQEPWKAADDLLKQHEDFAAKGRAALAGIDEQKLYTTTWALKMKGQLLSADPRHQVVADTLTHLAHHRGQLTVYLRLLGSKVASTYGPSADDNPWAPPKTAGA